MGRRGRAQTASEEGRQAEHELDLERNRSQRRHRRLEEALQDAESARRRRRVHRGRVGRPRVRRRQRERGRDSHMDVDDQQGRRVDSQEPPGLVHGQPLRQVVLRQAALRGLLSMGLTRHPGRPELPEGPRRRVGRPPGRVRCPPGLRTVSRRDPPRRTVEALRARPNRGAAGLRLLLQRTHSGGLQEGLRARPDGDLESRARSAVAALADTRRSPNWSSNWPGSPTTTGSSLRRRCFPHRAWRARSAARIGTSGRWTLRHPWCTTASTTPR